MQELMQKRKEQLAQATITQLRRRGFEAEWFDLFYTSILF